MAVDRSTSVGADVGATQSTEDPPGRLVGQPSPGRPFNRLVSTYGLVAVFAALIVGFSIAEPHTFATVGNAQAIAGTQSVVALLALAAVTPLIAGQFDVSIGYQLGLSQALCAKLIVVDHAPAAAAALVAVVACMVVGVVNAVLVSRVHLNSFIATLGTGTLVLGLTEWYTDDQQITGSFSSIFTTLGRRNVLGVPLPLVYVLVAMTALWIAFEYTSWGREAHASGGSPRAALLAGVRVNRVTTQCFVIAGGLAGVSGVLSVMILGASAPSVGLGELLPAFAGAFLGATAIRPGRFNAIGAVLAIYLLATGIGGLQLLGAQSYVSDVFDGGALVIAVTVSSLASRAKVRS